MLAQINGHPLHSIIKNTLLKSLLPFIMKNQQWSRHLSMISKIKNLRLVKEGKISIMKEGDNKCPLCEKFLFEGNYFILILHLEIQHECTSNKKIFLNSEYENELVVKNYIFTYDGMEICFVKRGLMFEQPKKQKKSQKISNNVQQQTSFKEFVVESKDKTFLQQSIKSRNIALLERIFNKFSKRLQTISTERKYYHSYNVYQIIDPDSQDSDQQREQPVEKELERLRINDFSDVSYWDKMLYLEWNNLIRKEKKQLRIIDNIKQVLLKFVIICKKKQIPKININIHLYTLWSVGKIQDHDIVDLLSQYETYLETDNPQSMEKQ